MKKIQRDNKFTRRLVISSVAASSNKDDFFMKQDMNLTVVYKRPKAKAGETIEGREVE